MISRPDSSGTGMRGFVGGFGMKFKDKNLSFPLLGHLNYWVS